MLVIGKVSIMLKIKSTMEKSLIDEAVSTLDLQGSNVKESTVEDKDLQAGASAGCLLYTSPSPRD